MILSLVKSGKFSFYNKFLVFFYRAKVSVN